MRKFTDQENKWIKNFVELKEKGISGIQELQVAKILRTEFSFFALKWTYGDNPQIFLYIKEKKNELDAENQYYKICDFIYFLKELESLRFIAIQKFSSEKENNGYDILYDREKFKYNETYNRFESQSVSDKKSTLAIENSILEEITSGVYGISSVNTQKIKLDFVYDLQKYGLGIIYPLPLAVDYVNNDFKTLEERHHDEEMKVALDSAEESRKAAKTASYSFIVAIISLIVSVIQICTS